MKIRRTARRKDTIENAENSADALAAKKEKLKKEIAELKSLIWQVETLDSNVTRFRDVTNAGELVPDSPEPANTVVPDVTEIFRHELYVYSGFYCAKATANEYVFNFATCDNKDEIFSVQILIDGRECLLGRWVMPMSVDMERILEENPLGDASAVTPFVKECKSHVDCYRQRKKQYEAFKAHISDSRNCEIESSVDFTVITLRLLGAYKKAEDSYVNLTLYLVYKPTETRPMQMKVDWNLKKEPSSSQKKEIKSYAKFLSSDTILDGFERMIRATDPIYDWSLEENVDSPLELSNSSDSEEDTIVALSRRKRKKIATRLRKDRELKQKWKKRQKTTSLTTQSQHRESTDEENEVNVAGTKSSTGSHDPSTSRKKSELPKNPRESELPKNSKKSELPKNSKKSELPKNPKKSELPKNPKKSELPKNPKKSEAAKVPLEQASGTKSGPKLRQTTISFSVDKEQASGSKEIAKPSPKKAPIKKQAKPSSTKATKIPVAKKKNVSIRDGKKSEDLETTPATTKSTKSGIPIARPKPRIVNIWSVKNTVGQMIPRGASTPNRRKVSNRGKLIAAQPSPAVSPITTIDDMEQ